MRPALGESGIVFCAVFLVTEAVRAVYFGGIFQEASSFVIGSLVFGAISAFVLLYTYLTNRGQLLLTRSVWPTVVKVNVLTAASWTMYFFAIQMIEPAVAYTVFSGVFLITMFLAAKTGVAHERMLTNRLAIAGCKGVALSIGFLSVTTVLGLSGFVRGTAAAGAAGLCLAAGASVLIAYAMIVCKRLDERGLAPLTQLGIRFLLYVLVAGALGALGLDAKGELPADRLLEIVALGVVLSGLATYAVQKAVSLLTAQAMGAASSFGPCLVFGLQVLEGRVDFTPSTLLGVCLYCISALTVSLAPLLGFRRLRLKTSALP